MIEFPDASPTFGENSPEAKVYAYVKDLLHTLGPQLYSVSLASVADALGWSSDPELRSAIVRALDQLALGRPSILKRQFLLWPTDSGDEVLQEPLGQVSDLEIRRALESNTLVLPETGERVHDFIDRITVEYIVRGNASDPLTANVAEKT